MGGFFALINRSVQKNLIESGVVPRKDASPGVWMLFLLPTAIVLGQLKHGTGNLQYKVSTCISAALFLHSCIILSTNHGRFSMAKPYILPGFIAALLLHGFTSEGLTFSIGLGALSMYVYNKLLIELMKLCPKSFTYGEAGVVTQAFMLFVTSSCVRGTSLSSVQCMEISTTIIQVGILSVFTIGSLSYIFQLTNKPVQFYALTILVITCGLFPSLYYLIGANPLVWTLNLCFEDHYSISLFGYWSVCSLLGVAAVLVQLKQEVNATTVVRKVFHVLAVLVFVPGIIIKPCLIYLASGVVFGIFIALDMLRILRIPPFGDILQSGFNSFADEKDEGGVSLTPLYLLVGCALPLWIHPNPCQSENLLPLLAGLLSVGVGDTVASITGTWVGKNKWPGSKKTKEGSAACFLSQLFLVIALIHYGYIPRNNLIKPTFAIAATSLAEAKTDQIDNLALPLLMYILIV